MAQIWRNNEWRVWTSMCVCLCQRQWVAVDAGVESRLHSGTNQLWHLQAAVQRCAYRASDKSLAPTPNTQDLWIAGRVQPVVGKVGAAGRHRQSHRTGAEPVSWYQPDQCLASTIRIGSTEKTLRVEWNGGCLDVNRWNGSGRRGRGHSQFVLPATSSLEGHWHFGDLISRLRNWKIEQQEKQRVKISVDHWKDCQSPANNEQTSVNGSDKCWNWILKYFAGHKFQRKGWENLCGNSALPGWGTGAWCPPESRFGIKYSHKDDVGLRLAIAIMLKGWCLRGNTFQS